MDRTAALCIQRRPLRLRRPHAHGTYSRSCSMAATPTRPTTISAGGVQLGNGGTAGSFGAGDVTINAPLTISRSNAWTLANNIAGSGSITHSGAGTTTLSGSNSFTGNVTVSGARSRSRSPTRLAPGRRTSTCRDEPGAPAFQQCDSCQQHWPARLHELDRWEWHLQRGWNQ